LRREQRLPMIHLGMIAIPGRFPQLSALAFSDDVIVINSGSK
jgi:hypothetical protein